MTKLKDYLADKPIKRSSKNDLKTLEIETSSLEELIEHSEFYPDAKGVMYFDYTDIGIPESIILENSAITEHLGTGSSSGLCTEDSNTRTSQPQQRNEWQHVKWCKCKIRNLPWKFSSTEKIRFRLAPDEKWNNTVFKTPTTILVSTLFAKGEKTSTEKRSDSALKRILKDKEIDVEVKISGDNYQYPA